MRRLGARGVSIRNVGLPHWKDALIFLVVVFTVAGSIVFVGFRLHRQFGEGEAQDQPDLFEPVCPTENQKRL